MDTIQLFNMHTCQGRLFTNHNTFGQQKVTSEWYYIWELCLSMSSLTKSIVDQSERECHWQTIVLLFVIMLSQWPLSCGKHGFILNSQKDSLKSSLRCFWSQVCIPSMCRIQGWHIQILASWIQVDIWKLQIDWFVWSLKWTAKSQKNN